MKIAEYTHWLCLHQSKSSMSLMRTPMSNNSAYSANLARAPSQIHSWLTDVWADSAPFLLRKPPPNLHIWLGYVLHRLSALSLSLCGLQPQTLDPNPYWIWSGMKEYPEASIKYCLPQHGQTPPSSTPFMSRQASCNHSRSAIFIHSCATTTAAAPYSPVQLLGSTSLTLSDDFHGRSQLPCTIHQSDEGSPDDLLTG